MTSTITPPTIPFSMAATSANFQNAFTGLTNNINNHILQTDYPHPDFTNATDTVTNSSGSYAVLVRRNASTGGANFGAVGITPITASGSTLHNIAALVGHTGNLYQGSVNGVTQYAVSAAGGILALGQLTVGSGGKVITTAAGLLDMTQAANALPTANGGTGLTSSGTSGNFLKSNGTSWISAAWDESVVAAGGIHIAKIADFAPSTNASASTITLAGGNAVDGNGLPVTGKAAQNVSLSNANSASQPSGSNSQWVIVSLATSTLSGVATGGTVSGSPSTPTVPTGNIPVALVLWRGTTANPSGIVAAGDIYDLRMFGSGASSGGGGGGGAPTSAQYILNGTNGSLPSAIDINTVFNGSSALGDPLALLKRHSTDAPHGDAFRNVVIGTIRGNITASGTALVLNNPAGQAPIFCGVGNVERELVGGSSLTSNNGTGAAAIWTMYLDVNTGGVSTPTFGVTSTSPGAGQIALGTIPWDGTAWHTEAIQYAQTIVDGYVYRPIRVRLGSTSPGAIASPGSGVWTLAGSAVTVYCPVANMMARFQVDALVTQASTAGSAEGIGIAYAAGTSVVGTNVQGDFLDVHGMTASSGPLPFSHFIEITGLAAGANTFQLVYITNHSAGNLTLSSLKANGDITLGS